MTTIICDLERMVCDSRVVDGDLHYPGQKVYPLRGWLVGVAGEGRAMALFIRWFEAGCLEPAPELTKRDGTLRALVLGADGIAVYDEGFAREPVKRGYHAVGTGASAAIGALMGAERGGNTITLEDAVEIACDLDNNSGLPVTSYRLADYPATPVRKKRKKG